MTSGGLSYNLSISDRRRRMIPTSLRVIRGGTGATWLLHQQCHIPRTVFVAAARPQGRQPSLLHATSSAARHQDAQRPRGNSRGSTLTNPHASHCFFLRNCVRALWIQRICTLAFFKERVCSPSAIITRCVITVFPHAVDSTWRCMVCITCQ